MVHKLEKVRCIIYISLLLNEQQYEPIPWPVSELCMTSPMIERMGAKFADNLNSPRLLKTHFTWHNVPKNKNSKYILAVRNPKDCLTRLAVNFFFTF